MNTPMTFAIASGLGLLACAASGFAADPIIDNERVTVWNAITALPAAQ